MEETTPTTEAAKGGMSKTLIVVVLIVVLVLAGGAYELTKSKSVTAPATTTATDTDGDADDMKAAPTAMTQTSPSASPSSMESKMGAYKDGVYQAEGEYISPGGQEQVGVSLTLKDGVITDATFTPKATRPMSQKYQGMFATGYKPLVVGKKIDEVKLDVVSGSSLTPKGFTDAVTKIKEQAKA